MRWGARWQKQNADAIEEMRTKYGTRILRTLPEVLVAFLKTWDKMAAEESAKDPFFKKVLDSQRAYAVNYYFPEPPAKGKKQGAKRVDRLGSGV